MISTKRARSKKTIFRTKRTGHCKHRIPNTTIKLIKKDFIYLIKENPTIWLTPVSYLIIFYLVGGVDLISYLLPFYFPIEFAMAYGFNYYGHDNDAFATVILSPVPRSKIIRAKNLSVLLFCLSFSCIAYIVGLMVGAVTLANTFSYFSLTLLTTSLMVVLCPHFSVKYYYKAKGKSKYALRLSMLSIALFVLFAILSAYMSAFEFNSVILFLLSIAIVLILITNKYIYSQYFAKELTENERILLDKFME